MVRGHSWATVPRSWEQHRAAGFSKVRHLAQAAALKLAVSNGENFVNDDDLRIEMRGDSC